MMKQFSLSALLVTGITGGAQAATASAIATVGQDVIFAATGTAAITITPVAGLNSGLLVSGTKLADVQATSTAGVVAIRWTPGFGYINPARLWTNEVTGKNSASNKLTAGIWNAGAAGNQKSVSSLSAPEWFLPLSNGSSLAQTVRVESDQTISADTYPLYIDAAVWVE